MKIPFPTVIDSTIIAAAKACERKTELAYFHDWKPKGESVHLHAGAAFARGLEVARRSFWEDGLDAEAAMGHGLQALILAYGDYQPPEDSAKTLERMCGAFEFYFDQCPLARVEGLGGQADGRPIEVTPGQYGIEFSFAEPLPLLHPETGDPLLYSGRADMIANFAEGIYVWDDKTASQLGASWGQQWHLRSQFTAYCWAARRAGINVNGVIVNGVSILKTKYGFAREITNRSNWEIDRWEREVIRVIKRLIHAWEHNDFAYNLDESCASYGGCEFRTVCKSPEPAVWLPMYFERRHWDPLTRTETLLEESHAG